MSIESIAVQGGQNLLSAIISKITTYIDYIKKCDDNLNDLLEKLRTLLSEKDNIDDEVLLKWQNNSKLLTPITVLWFEHVRNLVNDESMKRLMNTDMRVAKVMLRLMKNDLKKLVKDDRKMRELVVKVMKDITKGKTKDGNSEDPPVDENDKQAGASEVSNRDENDNQDKQVNEVLQKLMAETIDEFKELMQKDEKMAIAAMVLLETHKEEGKFKKLTEMDEEVAKIMAKARKMSDEEEIPSDNHDGENGMTDNVVANVDMLKNKVKNMLRPVKDFILDEEMLKTFPENVRLCVEAMGIVIGNRKELKAELMDSDKINRHRSCCCCVISYNYFSDRYYRSVAAKAMLDRIEELSRSKPDINNVTRHKPRSEMGAVPTDCVDLHSRTVLIEKIIKALKNVDALGVVGMGGSGKTTLATEIANSKANGMFETVVMVEISESPNIESIQNQIGDGLGLKLHRVHGIHEKAVHLHDRLKPEDESEGTKDGKKILIVLDNIWNKIDLIQFGIPRKYCKLLLTSRTKDVCKEMDVHEDNILEVELLSNDEAKHLFEAQIPKEVTMEYKSVVDKLLKKCRGLPIAIVATATSLKGKELPFWRHFAKELEKPISCQISGVHHETFSILRTSFEFMASEEKKKFFLLACLSPLGSSISIDNLMRYGIGFDLFQHVNKLSEAIELAYTWAEELVSSSMFLKGDSDEYVKIHDVVRESTMSFASKSGINADGHVFLVDAIPRWICEETFNKYTGISLLAQANYFPLSGVKADLLQILLLKGNKNHNSVLESNFFEGMANLKVLEVSFMNFERGLPESLCKLKVLKTLHLVECKLGDIKLIGELGSLLVLSLRGSSLKLLPNEIGKLYKLRVLDMSKCRCEQARFPANVIAGLSLLEGLYLVDSSFTEWAVAGSTSNDTGVSNNGADIDDLNKLEFLNVLEIHMQGLKYFPTRDQFVKNLNKFQISVGEKGLKPKPYQRALMVSKFDVSQEFKRGNYLKELLKKADFLALKSTTIKNVVPELDKEGFRHLSMLELSDIDSISRICEGKVPTGLFYNLCHLEVSLLNNLEELLPLKSLPQKLTTLKISECNSLAYIFTEDNGINKESDIVKLPCLKTLALDGVSNLISLVKPSNNDDSRRPIFFNCEVKLTSLVRFSLKNNTTIVKLWDKESNLHNFENLMDLEINDCEEMESIGPPSMSFSLVQLKSLSIENCKKMQHVISNGCETQIIPENGITFPKLKILKIMSSENFQCFYGGSYKMSFPCLEEVTLKSLQCMTKCIGGEKSAAFFPESVTWTSVKTLSLENNTSMVKFWDKESNLYSFQNLKTIEIKGCDEMENLGPLSMLLSLVQLERLTIHECKKMQQVISDGSEMQEVITFPNLKFLWIVNMENLECFYRGSYKIAFPHLETLHLRDLRRMTKFGGESSTSRALFSKTIEFSCLKDLWLSDMSDEVTLLWEVNEGEDGQGISSNNPLPNLIQLTVSKFKLSGIVFPSLSCLVLQDGVVEDAKFLFSLSENEGCVGTFSQFPKLEDLSIEINCADSIEQLVEEDGSTAMLNFCGQMRRLSFVFPSHMGVTALRPFKNLCELFIGCMELEFLYSADVDFELFQSLEVLRLESCFDLKELIQGGDKPVMFHFPSLEHLDIDSCDNLESVFCGKLNQVVEFPSLENVTIDAMKSLSTRSLYAPKLRKVAVTGCPEMKWLFGNLNCNADLELQSLENVSIKKCPNMKAFSPGVLKAPKLQLLTVDDKPYPIAEIGDFNHVLQSANIEEQTTVDKDDL